MKSSSLRFRNPQTKVKFSNPCKSKNRNKKGKGNLPYLRFRRKLRKDMFRM